MSFRAASSLGKFPLVLIALRSWRLSASIAFVTGMKDGRCRPLRKTCLSACGAGAGEYGATVRDGGIRKQTWSGRPLLLDGL